MLIGFGDQSGSCWIIVKKDGNLVVVEDDRRCLEAQIEGHRCDWRYSQGGWLAGVVALIGLHQREEGYRLDIGRRWGHHQLVHLYYVKSPSIMLYWYKIKTRFHHDLFVIDSLLKWLWFIGFLAYKWLACFLVASVMCPSYKLIMVI